MGKKTPLSMEYQAFLNLAKSNYGGKGKKNFFNYENVIQLKKALDAEIKNTKTILQNLKDISVETAGAKKKILNKADQGFNLIKKNLTKLVSVVGDDVRLDPKMDDLEYIKQMRVDLEKNEYTPFLKFAEKAKTAVNEYLDLATHYELAIQDVQKMFNQLYEYLVAALKEYRHTAKSHHYFRSSVGRAEIANKVTGGSLELWLNNSFKALSSVGTAININSDYKYLCRKATKEEENKINARESKDLPKIFKYFNKHLMAEIVNRH